MTDEERKALARYMKGECRQSYMDRSCRIDANKLAEAADQIKADGKRIAELEAALRLCAKHVDWMPHPHCVEVGEVIRAALGEAK